MDSITFENREVSITEFLNKNKHLCNAKSLSVYAGSIQNKHTSVDAAKLHLSSLCVNLRKEYADIRPVAISYYFFNSTVKVIVAVGGNGSDAADAVNFVIKNINSFQTPIKTETDFVDAGNKVCRGTIDPKIVQLTASNDEIQKRIKSYIDRKREQVNAHNIQDFILKYPNNSEEEENYTCSRVRSVFVKRKDSKGHLHVRKVENSWGPQTYKNQKTEDIQALEQTQSYDLPVGIAERIVSAEKYVSITAPVPKDIYGRLRSIEDRISQLEATSPEYSQFWGMTAKEDKYLYSVDDIDQKIKSIMDS